MGAVMDDCIHLLPPGQCSFCKPQPVVETEPLRVFPAKYGGDCGVCNLPIHRGQSVAWRQGSPVIHEECQ